VIFLEGLLQTIFGTRYIGKGIQLEEGNSLMNPQSQIPDSSTFTKRSIPRGEYRINACDYAGADPAFVLMHGFPDNLGIYDRLAPLLAGAGQRVIVFDFLGYGGSDRKEIAKWGKVIGDANIKME
jgi:pimeloyl-ACP methyl ester carboxylesterase